MNTITREGQTLFASLRETAATNTQELIDLGFYDPHQEGPHFEKFMEAMQPYLEREQHTEHSNHRLDLLIGQALHVGAAFQALGSRDIASLWYQIGQYRWRGQADRYEGNVFFDTDWSVRERPALLQENQAICSALIHNTQRAEQFFRWSAQNLQKTDAEMQQLEEGRDYNSIWQSLGFQIFALMWLGEQWPEVSRLSEIGRRVIEKTRRAGYPKDFREPQLLMDIGSQFSAYFLNPNETNRQSAVDSLRLDKMHDRDDSTRSGMLPYFFSLGQRYPEINPYPEAVFQQRLWRPSTTRRDKPLTRGEVEKALLHFFWQAEQKKKIYVQVTSIDLHLHLGGYPAPNHQLRLCCEVMRAHMKGRDRILGQLPNGEPGWLKIIYDIPR